MKKLLFIIIAIFFAQSVLNAQCNPDLNYTDPGFYPDTIINIPPAVVGEAYSTVINAVIPTEVELQGYTLAVDSVRVFSILNLPSNLSFTANTNSGFWLANTNGCFTIEGLPAIESIGLNELEIVLDYRVSFLGMAYEVPDTLKGYKLIVSNEPISAVTKYGQESSTSDNFVGENGKVTNTPLISSSGKIFQLPDVQTISVDNITTNSAIFNGNIIDNGGLNITQSGFCWNTVSNPTIADQIHIGYDQEGEYSANITGFDYNTEYFVKAYAKNAKGVSYGDEVSFMTLTAGLPEISTNEVTNIAGTTATCGGNVTSDGGIPVTAQGVCWSTSQNPTIADSHTTDGSGTGSFTSSITGLIPGTTYYVRAYVTNSEGTSYGNQVIFTSGTIPPTISTYSASSITSNSAISGGNVSSDGGTNVTSRGVCWSTSQNPTTNDSHTTDGMGTGSFTSNITSLSPGATYYARAYATNSVGTNYGNQITFTTSNPCAGITPPAGYGIVASSNKCWLDRNLGASQVATSSTDADSYGDLYQWGRASDGHQLRTSGTTTILSNSDTPGHSNFIIQSDDWRSTQNDNLWQGESGINNPCPSGYRLPTKTEWTSERQSWVSNDAEGAFASPLKLTVGGVRDYLNGSIYSSSWGNYYSSTVNGANIYFLEIGSSSANEISNRRSDGRAVRCIKD